MTNVLITGATGFIGKLLVKKLLDRGASIYVLAKNDEDVSTIVNVTSIRFTDYSYRSLKKVFPKNIDVVVHLAWAGVNGPLKGDVATQSKNIMLAEIVAKVSIFYNVKKFIGIGTITELAYLKNKGNPSPSILYGRFKYACYQHLLDFFTNSKTTFLWLRLANLYGNNNMTGNILGYAIHQLNENKVAEFGPCDQYYDFVYVDDEITAICCFIDKDFCRNSCYYLGSGKPRILKEYLLTLGKFLKKSDLIRINSKKSDNVTFNLEMFDASIAFNEIGNYISNDFDKQIQTVCGISVGEHND